MFKVVFQQSSVLRVLVDVLEGFSETNWELNQNGLYILAMDGSQVALVDIFIPADAFKCYEIARAIILGIPNKLMQEILKVASHKQAILSSVTSKRIRTEGGDSVNPDVLSLELLDDKKYINKFNIKLLNIEHEKLDIPDATWDVVCTMTPQLFLDICNTQKIAGDACKLIVTSQKDPWEADQTHPQGEQGPLRMIFVTNGTFGTNVIELTTEDVRIKTSHADLFINEEYSLKFLIALAKSGTKSEQLAISLSTEMPIVLSYDLKGMDNAHMRFALAPKKIEEN